MNQQAANEQKSSFHSMHQYSLKCLHHISEALLEFFSFRQLRASNGIEDGSANRARVRNMNIYILVVVRYVFIAFFPSSLL
ncbi:hypothetical protein ABD86_23660 [Paenibacillus alvei]|nr:hypothetical protein [Paenibacillus alvei]MBG9746758.1 hypothetical protein [Paenibacillus alvei]